MPTVSISNAYWIGQPVGQSSTIIYSSAAGSVIPPTNPAYVAFLAGGNRAFPWPVDATGAVTAAALDSLLAAYGLPPTGLVPMTKAELYACADAKVQTLLATPRSYTVSGLSGPVVDDCGPATAINMNAAWTQLSSLTYPFAWSDDNYTVWSMSQADLTAFLTAAFAYAASVWALMNGTAIPEIAAGTITTTVQIDALNWPT